MYQFLAILSGGRYGRHPEEGLLAAIGWAVRTFLKLVLVFIVLMMSWSLWKDHRLSTAQTKYDRCVGQYGATYSVANDYGMTAAEKYNIHWYNQTGPCGVNPSA